MASEPLVDVGIPTYARSGFLREAVESVLSQTLSSWRLFVSEDGDAPRGASDVLGPYLGDQRVHYFAARSRLGGAGNKNRLLAAGNAPYVALLDDDDRWHPEFLERRVDFLEAHPACGFVTSGFVLIDSEGRQMRKSHHFVAGGLHASIDFVRHLLPDNPIRTPTVLMRRAACDGVGCTVDERYPFMYDWDLWLRLALRFPVGYLDVHDADYRVHLRQETSAISLRVGEEALRLFEAAEEAIKREFPRARLDERLIRRRRAFWLVSASLDALEEGDVRAARRSLREAARVSPLSLLDRRALAAAAGTLLGRRGSHAIGGMLRNFVRARRVERTHGPNGRP
jgi:glycosyltransferase involved in cell wall biosynthesis